MLLGRRIWLPWRRVHDTYFLVFIGLNRKHLTFFNFVYIRRNKIHLTLLIYVFIGLNEISWTYKVSLWFVSTQDTWPFSEVVSTICTYLPLLSDVFINLDKMQPSLIKWHSFLCRTSWPGLCDEVVDGRHDREPGVSAPTKRKRTQRGCNI
jgi:hypothetical protein